MPEPDSQRHATVTDTEKLSWGQIMRTAELFCWFALFMIPLLYWISGAAVSTDQAWIRTSMIIVASVVVLSSATYRMWHRWQRRDRQT